MLKYASAIAMTLLASSVMDQSVASKPETEQPDALKRSFNIAQAQNLPFKFEGIADQEGNSTFRWTVAKEATFVGPVLIDGVRIESVTFNHITAFASEDKPQTLEVFLNDKAVGSKVTFTKGDQAETVTIPFAQDLTGDAVIRFVMANAAEPGNGDPRILALRLSDIDVKLKPQATQGKSGFPCAIL